MTGSKKGFTLIELLAVLVVLAILALIAIPIVIGIVNDAREKSYQRSIESYGGIVEKALAVEEMNDAGKQAKLEDILNNREKLKYTGHNVICEDGTYINGELTLTRCAVYKDNATSTSGDKVSKKVYNYSKGKVKESGIFDNYDIGTEITLAGEEYYVIEESGTSKDYVTALKATPLTVDEVNTYGGVGTENNHVNRYTESSRGTAQSVQGYGGMAYYSSETCGKVNGSWIKTGCISDYALSDVKKVVDGWASAKFTKGELKEVNSYTVRLTTVEELSNGFAYEWVDNGSVAWWGKTESTPDGLYSSDYSYWTMSQWHDSVGSVWPVETGGNIVNHYQGAGNINSFCTERAVRPVINFYKSAIENKFFSTL